MKEVLIFVAVALFASCGSNPGSDHSSKSSPTIIVAAAANLTDAFPEVGQRFTSQTGIHVVFSFGATADLAKQIENGAPFDVFAAADTSHVEGLENKGLLTPGSRSLYARGRLVMWSPANGVRLQRIEDLTSPGIERISIAKPDIAPYGRATVEALQALGIWSQIEKKVVYGQSVAQTKQFAATGNAEVAFIPLALLKPDEGSFIQVDERLHQPIDQSLGIVKGSAKQDEARKFVDFLLSASGQEILARKGYFTNKEP